MKKNRWFLLVLMVSLCALVTACGASDVVSNETGIEQASVEELSEYLNESVSFQDVMSPVDKDIFFTLYNIDETVAKDGALYMSTGATAEEIAVFKGAEGMAERIEEACLERVEAQKEGFENYVPAELDKLSRPVIKEIGNTIVMVICDDTKQAEDAIKNFDNLEI